MVELQFLNYALTKKDTNIFQDNGIDSDYFPEYVDEYNFIQNHIEQYKKIPDVETFISNFPNFDILNVQESETYLVDTLREEYLYTKSVPVIKKAVELLRQDANEASNYLQKEMVNLQPNFKISGIDIIHQDTRVKTFENKSLDENHGFIPTGFQELDDIIYGWQRGEEFVVLYARTNQGKSWVLVKFMQHAWQIGETVGYISPEMSPDKIGYRFDTLQHNISNKALVRGDTNTVALNDYENYTDELKQHENKFIVATPMDFNKKITVTKLRNFVKQNDITILAIDGITYLTDERYKRGDNKTTTLTNISEDLILLSNELQIPVLVVVQANRGGIKEDPNATPELEDIRDSDGIAQNATKVISLRQKNHDSLIMEVKKHRDAEYGDKLVYSWDIDTGIFNYIPNEPKEEYEDEIEKPRKEPVNTNTKKKVAF